MGRNLKNAVIAFLKSSHNSPLWSWCFHHPILLANVFFFFNVNVLFWVISHIQSSHWMIDLYWTVIPVLLVHYYATHPLGQYNSWRSKMVMLLTWVWSIRLAHNYFRREKWQWGAREDWRFTDMSRKYGKHWWWISFFAIYLAEQECVSHFMLFTRSIKPLNIWDFVAAAGLGLWQYSRHPNYFGEQLWWWGLVLLAWSLGHGWTFIGSLINSMCLAYVTLLVERRMLEQDHRAEAYRLYQKTTSVWIPWFRSSAIAVKDKST
ncbi:hypothetical protein SLA2020_513360 [Shorea laevis]